MTVSGVSRLQIRALPKVWVSGNAARVMLAWLVQMAAQAEPAQSQAEARAMLCSRRRAGRRVEGARMGKSSAW